jgi:ABC-type glycerol-3-phosphate transport system substrate-binding protein
MTDWADLEEVEALVREREAIVDGGRAAMWTSLESTDLDSEPRGLNVGVAPLPAGPRGGAGAYRRVTGYFISARTPYRQACWEWIAYLTVQPDAGRGVPARRSVVHSAAYRQRVGDDRVAAYEASVSGEDRPPSYAYRPDQAWLYSAEVIWLVQAYGQVVRGEESAEEALAAAQGAFDRYRSCVILRDAALDREGWVACLSEEGPDVQGAFDRYRSCVILRDAALDREGWTACLSEEGPDVPVELLGE